MYRLRAFEMVTVAANYPDEKKEVLSFLTKQQSSGKNLLFGDTDKYKLMDAFDPDWNNALPYTLLISPAGEVLFKQQGAIDPTRTEARHCEGSQRRPLQIGRPAMGQTHPELTGICASPRGRRKGALACRVGCLAQTIRGETKRLSENI